MISNRVIKCNLNLLLDHNLISTANVLRSAEDFSDEVLCGGVLSDLGGVITNQVTWDDVGRWKNNAVTTCEYVVVSSERPIGITFIV